MPAAISLVPSPRPLASVLNRVTLARQEAIDKPVAATARRYLAQVALVEDPSLTAKKTKPGPRTAAERNWFSAPLAKVFDEPKKAYRGLIQHVSASRDGFLGGVGSGILTFGSTMGSLVGFSGLSALAAQAPLLSALVAALGAGFVPVLGLSVGTGLLVLRVATTASSLYRGARSFSAIARLVAQSSGAIGGIATGSGVAGSSMVAALLHGMPVGLTFRTSLRHALWPCVGATVGFELLGRLAMWALSDLQHHATESSEALTAHLARTEQADHPANVEAHVDAVHDFLQRSLRSPWLAASLGVATTAAVLATGSSCILLGTMLGSVLHGVPTGVALRTGVRVYGPSLALLAGLGGTAVGFGTHAIARLALPAPTPPTQWSCVALRDEAQPANQPE